MTRHILAIHPDHAKAAQLKAIARQVGAEMRIVDSVDSALVAIGERLPDLILTPALLSAREDATLAGRLRSLGGAAAHIQTLTIPILEDTQPGAAMFRGLRRDRIRDRTYLASPDACGTDTFAQQVSVYLDRATEGRPMDEPAKSTAHARAAEAGPPAASSAMSPAQFRPTDTAGVLDGSDLDAFISEEMLGLDPDPTAETPAVERGDISLPIDDADAFFSDALSDFVSERLAKVIAEKPAEKAAAKPDTWRFFDPAQPRFVALLSRLNEIAGRRA